MKIYLLIISTFLLHITLVMAKELSIHSVHSYDDLENSYRTTAVELTRGMDTSLNVKSAPGINQTTTDREESVQEIHIIQQDNENTRKKQFMFLGLASVVRAIAIFQISTAQYHNKFGTALKIVAGLHILYGIYLLLEPMCKLGVQKYVDYESVDAAKKASEMSSAKNYALTGLGDFISGIEGVFFALAAPEDPLAPLAIIFGSERLLVGGISCAYPGYLMFKDTFPLSKCCSNKNLILNQTTALQRIINLKQKKLERARLQQFLNTGIAHAVRGGSVIFYLAHTMPSERYADMLRTFGTFELLYALYALHDPFVNGYHYLKGTHNNISMIEEGSMKSYILRAVGFIISAPVNIVYTLGAPDAKTPWIVGFSACSVLFGIYSGWNPLCDHYGFKSLKCKKVQIIPANQLIEY